MYHYGLGRHTNNCHVGFADPFEGMFTTPANVLQPGDPWYAGPDQGAGGTQEESKDMVEHPKIITEEEARGGGTATPPPAAPGGGLFSGWPLKAALAAAATAAIFSSGKKKMAAMLIAGAIGYVGGHFIDRQ